MRAPILKQQQRVLSTFPISTPQIIIPPKESPQKSRETSVVAKHLLSLSLSLPTKTSLFLRDEKENRKILQVLARKKFSPTFRTIYKASLNRASARRRSPIYLATAINHGRVAAQQQPRVLYLLERSKFSRASDLVSFSRASPRVNLRMVFEN